MDTSPTTPFDRLQKYLAKRKQIQGDDIEIEYYQSKKRLSYNYEFYNLNEVVVSEYIHHINNCCNHISTYIANHKSCLSFHVTLELITLHYIAFICTLNHKNRSKGTLIIDQNRTNIICDTLIHGLLTLKNKYILIESLASVTIAQRVKWIEERYIGVSLKKACYECLDFALNKICISENSDKEIHNYVIGYSIEKIVTDTANRIDVLMQKYITNHISGKYKSKEGNVIDKNGYLIIKRNKS